MLKKKPKAVKITKKLKNPKGTVVVMALIVGVILAIIGSSLLRLSYLSRLRAAQATHIIGARITADAALTRALYAMDLKLAGAVWDDANLPVDSNVSLPGTDASYSYTVTGDQVNGYQITATGTYGRSQRTVNCSLKLQSTMFEYGVFSESDLDLKNFAFIDGYNSENGNYNYWTNRSSTDVGTNSTRSGSVDMRIFSAINGDVAVGAGGDPEQVIDSSWATITGETYAQDSAKQLDVPVTPSLPYMGENPTGVVTQSGKYGSIDLKNNDTLYVNGNVTMHVTGNVEMKNLARIEMVGDSTLTMYVDGDVEMKNLSAINADGKDPTSVRIYSTSETPVDYDFKNGSGIYAGIYAPNADVTIHNLVAVYGAVVGHEVELKNLAAIHVDEALKEGNINDPEVSFAVKRWWE